MQGASGDIVERSQGVDNVVNQYLGSNFSRNFRYLKVPHVGKLNVHAYEESHLSCLVPPRRPKRVCCRDLLLQLGSSGFGIDICCLAIRLKWFRCLIE